VHAVAVADAGTAGGSGTSGGVRGYPAAMQTIHPLRLGMVGGGPGAFIGAVHRTAALMDGEFELVAGAFSSDPAKCRERAAQWGVEPPRAYGSWREMLASEAQLPADRRIDAVAIVTPNHLHDEVAIAALRAGFDVACDKPLTVSSERARAIAAAQVETGRLFLLTHNYTGYPLVREARAMVASGALGELRKVDVEYLQGWLATPLEHSGQKQADWRTDPARSGPGGALGDIGTHAFNLAEFVTGRKVTRLFGVRRSFVAGRRVDDDASALLEFEGGADGQLRCSQVCVGKENGLALRVFGTLGGLEWRQEHPNDLVVYSASGASITKRTGNAYLGADAKAATRTPAGHPEGYLEAFANLYREFATAIRAQRLAPRGAASSLPPHVPSIASGVRGVQFIEAVIASSESSHWVTVPS
jgi:predicted dehydrogenase